MMANVTDPFDLDFPNSLLEVPQAHTPYTLIVANVAGTILHINGGRTSQHFT